ncbi:hypothetical protein ACWHLZ_45805 [Streptomyces chartreusis]
MDDRKSSARRIAAVAKKAMGVSVLAASLFAASSIPSWADEEISTLGRNATSSDATGKAAFRHWGDKIDVCDLQTDGMSVYGVYRYYKDSASYSEGSHWQGKGSGSCDTWDHDFSEGKTILIRLCLDIPVLPDGCRPWAYGVA